MVALIDGDWFGWSQGGLNLRVVALIDGDWLGWSQGGLYLRVVLLIFLLLSLVFFIGLDIGQCIFKPKLNLLLHFILAYFNWDDLIRHFPIRTDHVSEVHIGVSRLSSQDSKHLVVVRIKLESSGSHGPCVIELSKTVRDVRVSTQHHIKDNIFVLVAEVPAMRDRRDDIYFVNSRPREPKRIKCFYRLEHPRE